MSPFKIALLPLSLVAVPAAAQSLSDTHEMRWAPAGKVPMVTYHPLKRCQPAPQRVHLSGKMQYVPQAEPGDGCARRIASNDRERTPAVARD